MNIFLECGWFQFGTVFFIYIFSALHVPHKKVFSVIRPKTTHDKRTLFIEKTPNNLNDHFACILNMNSTVYMLRINSTVYMISHNQTDWDPTNDIVYWSTLQSGQFQYFEHCHMYAYVRKRSFLLWHRTGDRFLLYGQGVWKRYFYTPVGHLASETFVAWIPSFFKAVIQLAINWLGCTAMSETQLRRTATLNTVCSHMKPAN